MVICSSFMLQNEGGRRSVRSEGGHSWFARKGALRSTPSRVGASGGRADRTGSRSGARAVGDLRLVAQP